MSKFPQQIWRLSYRTMNDKIFDSVLSTRLGLLYPRYVRGTIVLLKNHYLLGRIAEQLVFVFSAL